MITGDLQNDKTAGPIICGCKQEHNVLYNVMLSEAKNHFWINFLKEQPKKRESAIMRWC